MSEKEQTVETFLSSDGSQGDATSQKQEKPIAASKMSIEDSNEPVPHLHAKTYLTVFAVCLIYFAQLVNVVGAGAVRCYDFCSDTKLI